MSFKRALLRWHAAAGQQAEDAVERHIDTQVDLELAIKEGRQHAEELNAAASKVIAEKELAGARLERAKRSLNTAESSVRAAKQVEDKKRAAGDEQGAAEAHTEALRMAQQVVTARQTVESAQQAVELSGANAAAAQRHIEEEQDALSAMLAQKTQIQSKIDQAKMEEAMNASMASLTQAHETIAPTLDQVEVKAEERLAKAHADAQVQGSDAAVTALDIHHEADRLAAEDVLNELATSDT